MPLSETLRKQIQELIQREPVVLFMKGTRRSPACGFSAQVVQMLDDLVPSYQTVDVLSDPAMRDGIKEFSEWPTIPQLYVDGKFVGGCDIVRELFTNGELAKVLGADAGDVPLPTITVTEAAAAAFRAATDDAGGDPLHFQIGAGFQYDLYFGKREPGDLEVKAGGVTVLVDRATARRANGVRIDFVDGNGGGFKIDNPQEPLRQGGFAPPTPPAEDMRSSSLRSSEPPRVRQLTAAELKEMLERGEVELFDVRPAAERARASIAGARPLDDGGSQHLASLSKDQPVAFHCHHGVRSQAAAERAIAEGFTRVYNLRGGIDAWSSIDPSVARY